MVCALSFLCLSFISVLHPDCELPKLLCLDQAVCAWRVQLQVSALVHRRSHGRWPAGRRPAPLGPTGLSRQGVPLQLQASTAATAAALAATTITQSATSKPAATPSAAVAASRPATMAAPLDQSRHPHLHTPRADSSVQTWQLGQLQSGCKTK